MSDGTDKPHGEDALSRDRFRCYRAMDGDRKDQARWQIVVDSQAILKSIARRVAYSNQADVDDLVAQGGLQLIYRWVDEYDPDHPSGASFKTYLYANLAPELRYWFRRQEKWRFTTMQLGDGNDCIGEDVSSEHAKRRVVRRKPWPDRGDDASAHDGEVPQPQEDTDSMAKAWERENSPVRETVRALVAWLGNEFGEEQALGLCRRIANGTSSVWDRWRVRWAFGMMFASQGRLAESNARTLMKTDLSEGHMSSLAFVLSVATTQDGASAMCWPKAFRWIGERSLEQYMDIQGAVRRRRGGGGTVWDVWCLRRALSDSDVT